MAYCAETDVEALLAKWPITVSTQPTTAQTALLIAQVDARINMVLAGQGVTVPFTAGSGNGETEFAAFLLATCAQGAAVLVLVSMFPDRDEGDGGAIATLQALFDSAMEGLADGGLIPVSVLDSAAIAAPSAYSTRSPDSNEDIGSAATPVFKRERSTRW